MLEKPSIKDEKIITCLKQSYGLTVTGLEFLPLGYDANAGVYRVEANGQEYFLKVKHDTVYELSITLPRYLKEHGIEQVITPLPTITDGLWGTVGDFNLILYPFIRAGAADLSESQWIEFGALLKRVHTVPLSPALAEQLPKETFIPHPKWFVEAKQLQEMVDTGGHDNPIEKRLVAFWKSQQDEINTILGRTERLGQLLQNKSLPFALCHADIHTGNLLIDAQGNLFIVDWDQPILAPIERDLMFVTVGGFVMDPKQEALFFQGYRQTEINPLVMAYYRYERVMEDLIEFAKKVFSADATDETKADSLKWFMIQFARGSTVEAAHRLY